MQHSLPLPGWTPTRARQAALLPRGLGRRFDRAADADDLALGLSRVLQNLGFCTLTEMRLASGRRVDVIGLDRRSRFTVVEIKTSVADFRADNKWPDYLPYCDDFYFAVPANFPLRLLPEETGLMVADRFDGEILRPSLRRPMTAGRRRQQVLLFAHTAGARLSRASQPEI